MAVPPTHSHCRTAHRKHTVLMSRSTLSLGDRVKRQREGVAFATPPRTTPVGTRSFPSPVASPLHTGDLRGRAPESPWWKAQHESASRLDGLLTRLGVSSSQPFSFEEVQKDVSTAILKSKEAVEMKEGLSRSVRQNGATEDPSTPLALDNIDGLLNSVLASTACENDMKSITHQADKHYSMSTGAVTKTIERLHEVAHEATGHEMTLHRRLEVLQAHNEHMAQQTEDLVRTVNSYQIKIRQLNEDLSQRDSWIKCWMNSGDVDFASQNVREGLHRRLHKLAKETDNRASGSSTVLDVRKAQALADEMSTREREVRERLVEEAHKSRASHELANAAQIALEQANQRVALAEAEVSLLRQQLTEALLSKQQMQQELTKSRGGTTKSLQDMPYERII